jgi:hypothetical protein
MARHLNWAIDDLIRESRLRVDRRDYFGFRSAKAISEFSHMAAWEAVKIGDIIPYYSA